MNPQEVEVRRQAGQMFDKAESIVRGAAGRSLTRGEQHAYDEAVSEAERLGEQAQAMATQRTGDFHKLAQRAGLPVDGFSRSEAGMHPMPQVSRAVVDQLWDNFRSGRTDTVEVDRVAVAPPQSTVADYRPAMTMAKRYDPLRVADLMPMDTTGAPSVVYYQETTNLSAVGATAVAEGGTKPVSGLTWTAVPSTVRKIAHYTDVTKEALEDYQGFQQLVTSALLAGLLNAENAQLMTGDGTGVNLLGLLNQSGILTYTPGAVEARLISILKAQTLLQQGAAYEAVADAVVINPVDWQTTRLSTASGSGEFLIGDTLAGNPNAPWGIKVVVTNRIPAGTALVGNFADAALIFQREAPMIGVDPYSQSVTNTVRFICEERLALAVPRPAALCKVTFNGTV